MKRILKRFKKKFIDYWIGFVDVTPDMIYGSWPEGSNRLLSISIIACKHKKGSLISDMPATKIDSIIEKLGKKKKLQITLYYGCNAYQECILNKFQQKLLKNKLQELKDKWIIYIDDEGVDEE